MEQTPNNLRARRWIAVAIALFLFVSSVGSLWSNMKVDVQETNNLVNRYLNNSDFTETVEQGTNTDERILVIPVHGTVGDDSSDYNHEAIVTAIKQAETDPTIVGVLLDVDTPGGYVYHGTEVYNRLMALKEQRDIPIYTSMGMLAASAGYLISSVGDMIYAAEDTTTGSIGVITSMLNYSQALDKLGLSYNTFTSGEYKDTGSPSRELREDEKKMIQEEIDQTYEKFVNQVATARHMEVDQVKKLADGRTYTGEEALENGLVDKLGYRDQALEDLIAATGAIDPQVFQLNQDINPFDQLSKFPFKLKLEMPQLKQLLENITPDSKLGGY